MIEYLRLKLTSSFIVRLLALILIANVFIIHRWSHNNIIASDTFSYYAYLPSFFLRHDVTLQFLDTDHQTHFNNLWYSTSDIGVRFTKMPMGWSLMNLPFFAVAHLSTKLFDYTPDGFSLPYQIAICLATLFYVCLALFLLRKFLLNYFPDTVVSLSLLTLVCGTNLYHYTVFEPGMTHPLSFFLFTCFVWLTVEWHKRATRKRSVLLGFLAGLIVLTRATNVVVFLVFIFYGFTGRKSIQAKFHLLKSNIAMISLIVLTAFIVLIPQFIYWKLVSGHFIFYSYTDEHFFFSHPHILEGLVGFRKGWLLYTPVMFFALAGLFIHAKTKEWLPGLWIFTFFNTLIILSWWCWWYGGSFGGRSFIESYALLSLPLSSFFHSVISKRALLKIVCSLIGCFIFLNLYQTAQYKHGVLHYDSMTKEAYVSIFLKEHKPDNFSSLICHPDYFNAKLGKPERGDCILHDHNNP